MQLTVTSSSQARASTSSVVDFDPRHEVILLCGPSARSETAALAETLLALGFDAFVLAGTPTEIASGLEAHGQGERPALLVGGDAHTDTPVLRSRVARVLTRPHSWLAGASSGGAPELQRRICARMDALEREQTQEGPFERLDVEEVSNVVLLPVAPANTRPTAPASVPASAPAPVPTSAPTSVPTSAPTSAPAPVPARPPTRTARLSRVQLLFWPLLGAVLTAGGMAAIHIQAPPPETETTPSAAAAVPAETAAPQEPVPSPTQTPTQTPTQVPTQTPPETPPAGAAVVVPPPPPAPEDAAASTDETPSPLASHERVASTDAWWVYEAAPRSRDWYAAMDLCRGRTLAGVGGWSTPSSKQLNALAKARVLPADPLWSRTRALKSEDTAFVVHGRAGTVRRAFKTETIDTAVCIRSRSSEE